MVWFEYLCSTRDQGQKEFTFQVGLGQVIAGKA